MKFYENQHKLAAYLERNPDAEWEFKDSIRDLWHFRRWKGRSPSATIAAGHLIRPVLRYGLPSHLQSEIHNPDSLTEAQICEGGKYRAVTNELLPNEAQYWDKDTEEWTGGFVSRGDKASLFSGVTLRLPATVPWPDWEQEEATQPDPKDARIAELEMQLLALSNSCETLRETCSKITSPWRRMSEVPTEADFEGGDGYIVIRLESGSLQWLHQRNYISSTFPASFLAWMPVPKFHGWSDPLADLLKAHGVAVTPEILAALNAWKGVEK